MFDWLLKRKSNNTSDAVRLIEPKLIDAQDGNRAHHSESAKEIALQGGQVIDQELTEEAQLEQAEQDLIQIRDTLAQMLPSMSEKVGQLQTQLEEVSAKNLELQMQLEQQENDHAQVAQLENDLQAARSQLQELEDLRAENEILLSGMFEAQEGLERQIIAQHAFEQSKAILDGRFERLLKRYSSYVDYQQLRIVSVDTLGAMPHIAWEMKDVFFAGTAFEKIEFKTLLKEGKIGLWVVSMKKSDEKVITFKQAATLFPEIIKVDVGQQKLLRQVQTSHWRAFGAAAAATQLAITNQWRDMALLPEFDSQFWSSALQPLAREFAKLPKVLRFDHAKLKQELVNPDYEHLWIELFDVSFGDLSLPKFEFRLGAAQVNGEAFSTLPKLEIPLIDGKIKPFESWYAESFDDFGGKFELRFDVDKQVFDIGVWAKLSRHDASFTYELFNVIPLILVSLSKANDKTMRPIQTWFKLINQAFVIMETYLTNKKNRLNNNPDVKKSASMQSISATEFQQEQLKIDATKSVLNNQELRSTDETRNFLSPSSRKNKKSMKN